MPSDQYVEKWELRMQNNKETIFWKTSVILLCLTGLSTGFFKLPGFWTSYVLDIVGPAWCYILIRVQYRPAHSTFLSLRFSPELAGIIILGICVMIETSQYFKLYDAHFDPWDFGAYASGTILFYASDKYMLKRKKNRKQKATSTTD